MKYNLSQIMTEAHSLRVKYNLSLSEGLKMSWAGIKTGTSYQNWKSCVIAAMKVHNTDRRRWNLEQIEFDNMLNSDMSPGKYLKTRKAIMSQAPCDIDINTLDFAGM
jgi:hypothetical protein